MNGFFDDLPKAELHLHLEGSVEPETLRELAPGLTEEEIRSRYHYSEFAGFIESYKWVIGHLRQPEDYALVARRLLARLAQQNVRYAETTLSAGVVLARGQDLEAIYEAVQRETARSEIEVWWILDAVRQFGPREAMRVAEFAAGRTSQGIVGFGIGGNEALGPVEWFGEVFAFARRQGLHLTVHAGETVGPESIWGALNLGAERIGHGIRAVQDPALMAWLRDQNIPLEICISSNVATGAVRSLKDHPLRALHEAGVPIVLNSDDPAMFHTSLSREYELAAREFGFSQEDLRRLAQNGFRYVFRPPPERPGPAVL